MAMYFEQFKLNLIKELEGSNIDGFCKKWDVETMDDERQTSK